ncbi:MAG: NUDIX hydrolase [Chloroflexota bacterium]
MSEEKWDVVSNRVVLEHPFLTVTMEAVRLPSGQVIEEWPIVSARDYVMVVAENEAGEILILEAYKHGPDRTSWMLVGGYLEPGEQPQAAARRELLEEAGYASDQWQPLGTFVVDGNRRMSTAHLFLARRAHAAEKLESDDIEQVTPRWILTEEAASALYDGRIAIMSSAVALALALPLLKA